MRKTILFLLLIAVLPASAFRPQLSERIAELAGPHRIGVSVISDKKDTLSINGDSVFQLCSVMKFHQAVALARTIGYPAILADTVSIKAGELHRNTWSPMRAEFGDTDFAVDMAGMLYYTLQMSDNNACDILFDRYLSPSQVDSVIRAGGTTDFAIQFTENQMHANPADSKGNFTTPVSAAQLMNDFFRNDSTEAAKVVKAVMASNSDFGKNRIIAGLPHEQTTVFHKTGTGFNHDGLTGALNDVAYIVYPRPDGSLGSYTLAVFLDDFKGSQEEGEKIIADISAEVWHAIIMDQFSAMQPNSSFYRGSSRLQASPSRPDSDTDGSVLAGIVTELILDAVFDRVFGF